MVNVDKSVSGARRNMWKANWSFPTKWGSRVMSISLYDHGRTDGWTGSHSNCSAYMRVVQNCLDFKTTCYTGTVEIIVQYILEQSVLVRAVPELWGRRGGSHIFGKALSPFCIPVARQCFIYLFFSFINIYIFFK